MSYIIMLHKVLVDAEVSAEAWRVDIFFCEYYVSFVPSHRPPKEDT
jgi:hypothetical protein